MLGEFWLSGELDDPIVHGAICVRSPSFDAVRVRIRLRCRPLGDVVTGESMCAPSD